MWSTRSLIVSVALFAFVGCAGETIVVRPQSPDVNVEVIVPADEPTETTEPTETDTGDTETTETDDTGDTGTITTTPLPTPTLEVSFTPAPTGAANPFTFAADQQVTFGALALFASDDLWINTLPIRTYVNNDVQDLHSNYSDNARQGVAFVDHFESCILLDYATGTVMSGPADPTASGLVFTDAFQIVADPAPIYEIRCMHRGAQPAAGGAYGFAMDVGDSASTVATRVSDDEAVEVEVGNMNGEFNPTVAAILYGPPLPPDPCDGVPELEIIEDSRITTVVKGANDVVVWRSVIAASSTNALLTDLTLTFVSDDDDNVAGWDEVPDPRDHFSSCWLELPEGSRWTDYELIAANGTVSFSGIGLDVPAHWSKTVELHCGLTNDDLSNDDRDRFAAYLASAEDLMIESLVDGDDMTDQICYPFGLPNSGLDGYVDVINHGDLTLAWNGPAASNVQPGEMVVPALNLWATSINEGLLVSEVPITLDGDIEIVDRVRLSYPDSTGNTRIATMIPVADVAWFTGLDLLLDRPGEWQDIEIALDISATAHQGQWVELTFEADGLVAEGQTSGEEIPLSSIMPGEGITSERVTVGPCVTVSLSASSPNGSGFTPGWMEILRFNVTAHCPNTYLRGFDIQYNWTDIAGSGWGPTDVTLYNLSTMGTGFPLAGPGTLGGNVASITVLDFVPEGATYTYVIWSDTTGASSAQDDAVSAMIPADSVDIMAGGVDEFDIANDVIIGGTISF